MEGEQCGPLLRVWLRSKHGVVFDARATRPDMLPPEDGVPVLILPEGADMDEQNRGAGYAIADLFLQRYGEEIMVRAIGSWEAIVQDLEQRDMAAD
jgi:hypothetical protein